jgi:hypothetical protein
MQPNSSCFVLSFRKCVFSYEGSRVTVSEKRASNASKSSYEKDNTIFLWKCTLYLYSIEHLLANVSS